MTSNSEDYIKAIFQATLTENTVGTSKLAKKLGVRPASVTGMLRKLSRDGFVKYDRYRGARLTVRGRRAALKVLRRHRLVELLLVEVLGVPWDKVHDEAERLEHVISEDLEQRLDEVLGHPKFDPHGAPIPTARGELPPAVDAIRLSDVSVGDRGEVVQVADGDPELLKYLAGLGLVPGGVFTVVQREPFGGPFGIKIKGSMVAVGREAAEAVRVKPVSKKAVDKRRRRVR